MVEFDRIEFT